MRIAPDRDVFRRAFDPRMVFDALAGFGGMEVVCDTSQVPVFDALDPLDCHLQWVITLDTDATDQAIVETLDSFLADHEFRIGRPGETTATATDEPAATIDAAGPDAEASDGDAASAAAGPSAPAAPPAGGGGGAGSGNGSGAASGSGQPSARRTGGGTIRVDLDRIDKLMNLVGEIVITQSMLTERAGVLPKREAASFVDALSRSPARRASCRTTSWRCAPSR